MMKDLLNKIRETRGCRVFPGTGMPAIEADHELPADLREFYELCGGVHFFADALFSVRISSPSELVPANPVIIGRKFDDLSSSWYIIGRGGGDEFISIDLHP